MNPRLGGVTVLLQVLQFILAMLSQLLSLELYQMFCNIHSEIQLLTSLCM